jgi:hypothetical protein
MKSSPRLAIGLWCVLMALVACGGEGTSLDAGPSVDAGVSSDAGAVLGLGPLQCIDATDCAGPAADCNRSAPGGICLGCGTDSDCPDGTACLVGACVRSCDATTPCHVGFECRSSGRCALRSCSATAPCPVPYVCGTGGRCERPACGPATGCAAPLLCDRGVCVEPR